MVSFNPEQPWESGWECEATEGGEGGVVLLEAVVVTRQDRSTNSCGSHLDKVTSSRLSTC